jgi:hypothetical protein
MSYPIQISTASGATYGPAGRWQRMAGSVNWKASLAAGCAHCQSVGRESR